MTEDAVKRQSEYNAQLDDVTGRIETLVKAYDELEISDTAAADAEVTAAQQAMPIPLPMLWAQYTISPTAQPSLWFCPVFCVMKKASA